MTDSLAMTGIKTQKLGVKRDGKKFSPFFDSLHVVSKSLMRGLLGMHL